MAFWLKVGPSTVGVGGAVIPREEYAQLMTGTEMAQSLLDGARAEAAIETKKAEARAAEIVAEAEKRMATASRLGYHAGHQKALVDWHARTASQAVKMDAVYQQSRERMAELVCAALERVASTLDSGAILAKTLESLDATIEGTKLLTIVVARADLAAAKTLVASLKQRWGTAIRVKVQTDASLEAGSCRAISDFGSIESSFSAQMKAMSAAVKKVVQGEFDEEHANLKPPAVKSVKAAKVATKAPAAAGSAAAVDDDDADDDDDDDDDSDSDSDSDSEDEDDEQDEDGDDAFEA